MDPDPFTASGFVGMAIGLVAGLMLGVWGAFQAVPGLEPKPSFCPACGYEGGGKA